MTRAFGGTADVRAAQVKDVLRARARALAQTPPTTTRPDAIDALVFGIGDERFALEARFVLGVFRVPTLCLLPPAAAPLIGITEWRGDLLTLLDLRRALGQTSHALTDRTVALALGERQPSFGILADAVHGHRAIPLADLAAAPSAPAGTPRHLRGITSDAVLLVDALALLEVQPSPPNGHSPLP